MSELILEKQNHTLTVTLNRPDIHNAMSHTRMIDEIEAACERANSDNEVRVMIITGAGKSFCAGGNVKDMQTKSDMFAGNSVQVEQAYKDGIQRIPLALWNVKVPVIAAVNGAAVGAGCDLAMMCDIRIGSTYARFAESFVKLGIIPGDGGAWFLPRIIGMARATEMSLTGRMLNAEQALSWELISEVLEPDKLLTRAHEIASEISSNPPLAVQKTKALLRQSYELQLTEMLGLCAENQARLHQTEDHIEAVNSFLEKRPGKYSGR